MLFQVLAGHLAGAFVLDGHLVVHFLHFSFSDLASKLVQAFDDAGMLFGKSSLQQRRPLVWREEALVIL